MIESISAVFGSLYAATSAISFLRCSLLNEIRLRFAAGARTERYGAALTRSTFLRTVSPVLRCGGFGAICETAHSLRIQLDVPRSPKPGLPAGFRTLNNAEIADHLSALAQLLTLEKANPYKIRAYRRAAATIRGLGESVDELVRNNADLRIYAGIGEAPNGALREIVLTGTLTILEKLRSKSSPELVAISAHPRLDPRRVLRIYKRLSISTIEALRSALESGAIERTFGARMAQHVKHGLVESESILLYHAHQLRMTIEQFLTNRCTAVRAEAVGEYRRCIEVIKELAFVVETGDFRHVVETMQRFGGRTPLLQSSVDSATYALPSSPRLRLELSNAKSWGLDLIRRGSRLRQRASASPEPYTQEQVGDSAVGTQILQQEIRRASNGRSRRSAIPWTSGHPGERAFNKRSGDAGSVCPGEYSCHHHRHEDSRTPDFSLCV
jgi:DNA polymerase/3'-5' exonuclease PolX